VDLGVDGDVILTDDLDEEVLMGIFIQSHREQDQTPRRAGNAVHERIKSARALRHVLDAERATKTTRCYGGAIEAEGHWVRPRSFRATVNRIHQQMQLLTRHLDLADDLTYAIREAHEADWSVLVDHDDTFEMVAPDGIEPSSAPEREHVLDR
jgi:hypothetical protein